MQIRQSRAPSTKILVEKRFITLNNNKQKKNAVSKLKKYQTRSVKNINPKLISFLEMME
jgi:hypothetical protein